MEGFSNKEEDSKKKNKSVCLCVCYTNVLSIAFGQFVRRVQGERKPIVLIEKLTEVWQPSSCITYSQTSSNQSLGTGK